VAKFIDVFYDLNYLHMFPSSMSLFAKSLNNEFLFIERYFSQ